MNTSPSLICLLFFLHSAVGRTLNNKPIIGVLFQKLPSPISGVNGTSYLSAAYVKYLESAGARVVPIPIDITKDELKKLFSYINGVIFPGGDADLMSSGYQRNAEYIIKLTMEAFHKEDYFPVWGTCLGLQAFAVILLKSDKVVTRSDGTWDKSMSLEFTKHVFKSKMFSNAPKKIMKIFESDKVTYNAHYNCVSIHSYTESRVLQSFFKVLSTNRDSRGKSFISTMEGMYTNLQQTWDCP